MIKFKKIIFLLLLPNLSVGEDIGKFYRKANRKFSANLYEKISDLHHKRDFVVSPFAAQFSIFTALLMATFNSAAELSKVSYFPDNTEMHKLHEIHKYVSAYLLNTSYPDGQLEYLNVANWMYYLDKDRSTIEHLGRGNPFKIYFNHLQDYTAILKNMHSWFMQRLVENYHMAFDLQELLLVNKLYLKIVWPAVLHQDFKYFGHQKIEMSYITGHFFHFKSDVLNCEFLKLPIAEHLYRFPKDWQVGVILPVYKNGDKKECQNYRGITLLSAAVKIYERVLTNKLLVIIEPQLEYSQSGFRKGYSLQDHVFTLKQTINKILSQDREAYLAFVDIEKAFDRTSRNKIWEILQQRGVSNKLISAIKSVYNNNSNYVRTKNMQSEQFTIKDGLRQGGVLSPILFITLMDHIVKQNTNKIKKLEVGYRNLQKVSISECIFADDVVIIAKSEKDLQYNVNVWKENLEANELRINEKKTKVMVITKDENKTIQISLGNNLIQQVKEFKYLGVVINNKGNQEIDVQNRINTAIKAYYSICKTIVNKKEVSKSTKMLIYKTIYQPILLFGSETWILSKCLQSKIQAAEMLYLRGVKQITRLDRVRNQDVREELNIKAALETIEEKQLGWWGHLQRLNKNRPVKEIWECKILKSKQRGRPNKTWDNVISAIFKKKGISWKEAKMLAENKKQWYKFVHEM